MTAEMKTVIVPVRDLKRAKRLYGELLGAAPYVDEAYYVGFRIDGQELGLDPNGHDRGMVGPVGYWHVDDIEERFRQLLDAGAEAEQEIQDVGEGRRIATVRDADSNVIGLLQSA